MKRNRRSRYERIVRERYKIIYGMAVEAARRGDYDRARELGSYLWTLYLEARVPMPRRIKRGICRKCKAPLIPGVTARVRIRSQGCLSYRVITCGVCGWIHRYPYRRTCGDDKDKGTSEEGASR